MVTTTSLEDKYVAVQIRNAAHLLQLLGEIVWTKDIGQGFHNTGVQFLLRLGRGPITGESVTTESPS
jgi:hypothetical protein